jgi:hypothetical protein
MKVGQMGPRRFPWPSKYLLQRETNVALKAGLTLVGHSSPDIVCHNARIGVLNARIRYCSRRPAQIFGTNSGLKNAE